MTHATAPLPRQPGLMTLAGPMFIELSLMIAVGLVGTALAARLSDATGFGAHGLPAIRPLADVERDHILGVLEAVGGNRTKAAAALGIGIATLFRKLKEYHV